MSKTKVVSAFPGMGKSSLTKEEKKLKLLDLDSSSFSWANGAKTLRNENFPLNYIESLQEHLKRNFYDFIFISSHEVVRRELIKYNIEFYLIYPPLCAYSEMIGRYVKRGSDKKFINLLENNFDNFVSTCKYSLSDENFMCRRIETIRFMKDILPEIEHIAFDQNGKTTLI